MSQHASFGSGGARKKIRSVLKRFEKVEHLQKKGLWTEEHGVLGLPKVKILRIKAKKEKAEPKAEGAEGAPPPVSATAGKDTSKTAGKDTPKSK